MCGIVAAAARKPIISLLVRGLLRLEYRGYDSAGIAVLEEGHLRCVKRAGKISELRAALEAEPLSGSCGIAHTRWATHGMPSAENAHPHLSGGDIALVHNGIIENHAALREELQAAGYEFFSATDTEAVVHLVHHCRKETGSLGEAVRRAAGRLEGTYALAVIARDEPERIIAARSGSPLVIGLGEGENFLASDAVALRSFTDRFIYLEEGDCAEITPDSCVVQDLAGKTVKRATVRESDADDTADKGRFRHFMQKEIFEQPSAVQTILQCCLDGGRISAEAFGPQTAQLLSQVQTVHIAACGTSYHAGLVARYWIESLAKIPCTVEVASEYRYRDVAVPPGALFVVISQSGETADTLAALRRAQAAGYLGSLGICNVHHSSLVRESKLVLMTEAGQEIGVASTKAFTTQLVALLLLALTLAGQQNGGSAPPALMLMLQGLPQLLEQTLALDEAIRERAERLVERHHALFLGRGVHYPVVMEGALKLKEISYIHAEAYPAGELKHGPLALVDERMPVVALLPDNSLREKVISNLEEVHARGGDIHIFADPGMHLDGWMKAAAIEVPAADEMLSPIVYALPLQLLAYHVAVLKGTDVDQPRNLAKSVTVE